VRPYFRMGDSSVNVNVLNLSLKIISVNGWILI
jgi:hypothetical protein